MQEIIKGLWLGSDDDHEKAAARKMAILVCAKDGGQFSHRSELKYVGHGAPKGTEYYYVIHDNHMHLNLIDPDTPQLIPAQVINPALEFIKKYMDEDKPILVHCNRGKSRSPSIVLAYLRTIGEMPNGFLQSEKKFKIIYPPYDPMQGMRSFVQANWRNLLYTGKTENVHTRYTKEEVKYEFPAKMDHFCKDCINFKEPNGCGIVVGFIQEKAWCDKWETKKDLNG